ncbi:hypothetical protein [Bacillus alkalicola]|uniref:Uncharacterized protein n=1 Tax=Evansella alkalicola TaxID=745819 RepID=A0ABS6JT94_9BACI|nr:hypothetical protein [Bacillus alkalicola]MBU9721796.1 hypothetical protein [Bacillus alkalicola]
MLFRFFILFIGFGLAVAGGISIVAYLNLLTVGYSVIDYIIFLSSRVEFYLFLLGIILIWGMIYLPFKKN